MRAFYLIAIVFSLAFVITSAIYIGKVINARTEALFRSLSYDSYDSYGSSYYDSGEDDSLTQEAGFISLFFLVFYAVVEVMTFIKLKTKTMKVITIIGISFTGIMLAWDALMISSPGGISFDEVGVAFMLFGIIQLAFSIIGTVHAFRVKA